MFTKFLAALGAVLLTVGLSVVAVAMPASAHTGDLNATAVCNTTTGNYDVTYTLSISSTSLAGSTYWRTGTTSFEGTPTSNNGMTNGPVASTGAGNYTLGTISVPGTSTKAPWAYAYTTWTDGYKKGSDGGDIPLAGTCKVADVPVAVTLTYVQDCAVDSTNTWRVTNPSASSVAISWHNSTNSLSGTHTATPGDSTFETPRGSETMVVSWGGSGTGVVAGSATTSSGTDIPGTDPACLKADASASVTITPATCQAGEQLVLNTPVNATWGDVTGNYSVTATAVSGHTFPGGALTQTFTGTLAPKLSSTDPSCVPPPVCIPRSAVSYTYNPATNSGVITVEDVPNSTGELCQGFWVTATSWKYTTNSTWPQVRDIVQKLPKITTPGTYPYEAAVTCGQGDIYASFVAQPDPTPNLYGPSNPFPETFLHNMGFTGVGPNTNPTWVQQNSNCIEAPVAIPIATKITQCGTYGSVSVPEDTDKIDYTVVGTGNVGIYTVTAVAKAPYILKNYPAGGWTFDLGQYVDCAHECTATTFGGKSTNLAANGWDFSESRSGGHHEYVANGLRIYTDAADYNGKSAGYVATDLNLEDVGTPVLNFTNTSGGAEPGINLSLIVNGVWQGNLVKEPLFSQWWLGKAVPGMPAGPNPSYQKAYGSLDDFLFAYAQLGYTGTEVKVVAIGYSLGSGAKGDGILTSITAGCINYTFGAEKVLPTASYRLGVCYPNGEEPDRFSSKNLYIILDNSGSTVPVTFTVVGAPDVTSKDDPTPSDIVRTLAPGETLEVETSPIWDQGGSYTVTFAADGATIPDGQITVPAFEGCLDGNPGDPSHTNQQCVAGVVKGGTITVELKEGFTYTITGPNGFTWVSADVATVTDLEPGTYEVTVEAAPGYILTGPAKWPYEVVIEEPVNCVLIPISAIVPQEIACDADGSFTLPTIKGVTWFVDGVKTEGVVTVKSAATFTLTFELTPGTYWDGTPPSPWTLVFADPSDCVKNDADASIGTILATCAAPGSIDTARTSLTNATWVDPLPTAPGSYTVVAKANAGHAFAGGATTKSFPIVIQQQLDPKSPFCDLPTEGLSVPTYTFTQATCTAPGSYTVGASINPEWVEWREQGSDTVIPFNTKVVVNPARTVTLVATSTDPVKHGLQAPSGADWTNPVVLTFTTPSDKACDLQLTTLALTGLGSGLGLTLAGGLVFLGIGGLLVFARRRQLADHS